MIINILWKKIVFNSNFYRKIINKKTEYKKFIVKTRNRNIVISDYLLFSIIKIYNGKKYIPIAVDKCKVGYRLKEFLYTVNRHKFFLNDKFIKK